MGRIKNKVLYTDDPVVSMDDYLVGSNAENFGKTQNYPIRAIVNSINGAVIATMGNESELGIRDGWDLIAEGVPIVAKNNELEFEYDEGMNVVLIKLSNPTPPIADIQIRTGRDLGNPSESESKWYKTVVEEGSRPLLDLPIEVSLMEFTLKNIEEYNQPRLVVERYRPRRYKGKTGELKGAKKFGRGSFKKEEKIFGETIRPNDIPITSKTQMIDLGADKYFRVVRKSPYDPVDGFYRMGTSLARASKGSRDNSNADDPLDIVSATCMIKIHVESLALGKYRKVSQDYFLNLRMISHPDIEMAVINIEQFPERSYYNVRSLFF